MNFYRVGQQVIPLHAICGEWWEILGPNDQRFCVIVGTKEKAQQVANHLNEGL